MELILIWYYLISIIRFVTILNNLHIQLCFYILHFSFSYGILSSFLSFRIVQHFELKDLQGSFQPCYSIVFIRLIINLQLICTRSSLVFKIARWRPKCKCRCNQDSELDDHKASYTSVKQILIIGLSKY